MSDVRQPETTLASAEKGELVCFRLDASGEDAVRLKRLGVCEGRKLELIAIGDPMIVRVCGARIGLSRPFAEKIVVRQFPRDMPTDANG